MFSRKLATMALITGVLSSCAMFDNNAKEEPNHSWKADKNYSTKGEQDATLATLAYSQGRFQDAENHVIDALTINPKQPQALLVGALIYEQTGRINRAKSYYEDLILIGGDDMSVLGSSNGTPEKITDIARSKLRTLTIKQSSIVIEDVDGTKVFAISSEASQKQGKSAMEEALFVREQRLTAQNKASAEADIRAVELLFDDSEKNIISRFLIIKELAEQDLITKEEFLSARSSNLGGLLPLTHKPAAYGANRPVPSAELIIDRINSLKEAVETRAITSKEFSSERNLIVDAILPPRPAQRLKPKAPAKDLLAAAKELRKIEVIYDLNLITAKEKEAERRAIEKHLGLSTEATVVAEAPAQTVVESKHTDVVAVSQDGPTVLIEENVKTATSIINPENEIRDPLITNPF